MIRINMEYDIFKKLPDGTIQLGENTDPIIYAEPDSIVEAALEFLGSIAGDDLSKLVNEYNDMVLAQQKLDKLSIDNANVIKAYNALVSENASLKKVRDVQVVALNKAEATIKQLTAELAQAKELDKKLTTSKDKVKELQGKLNQQAEIIKNQEFKLTKVSGGIECLKVNASHIVGLCKQAEELLYKKGQAVERTLIDAEGNSLKICKVPINQDSIVSLQAQGIPVSLSHNYLYTVTNPVVGSQYFYAGETEEDIVSIYNVDFSKNADLHNYLVEQFKTKEVDFSKAPNSEYTVIAKEWSTIVNDVSSLVLDIKSKFYSKD